MPLASGVTCIAMEHFLEELLILLTGLAIPEDIGLGFVPHVIIEDDAIVSLVEKVANVW